MSDGWIKLHRKCLDTGILKNHKTWVFWSYCIMKASHKKHKQIIGSHEIILLPGQFVFGRKKVAKELGMSEQNIRTCLNNLKNHENLTIKPTNKFSIITIINWDAYQSIDNKINQQINQGLTSNQPATNHKQECKKERKKDIVERVIKYLNAKTGKNFQPATKETIRFINARIKEKYTTKDFKKVIDIKCTEWLDDPDKIIYLRPETLFGHKFEGYLNSAPTEKVERIKPKQKSMDELFKNDDQIYGAE